MAEIEQSTRGMAVAEFPDGTELRFDHIGVVVPELETGRQFLQAACGVRLWTEPIVDPGIGVTVQFGVAEAGGPQYELVTPLPGESPVSRALERGRNLLNHLAYRTSDLERQGERLRALGCVAVAPPGPAVAYGGSLIQFWMTPLRFLLEVIESPEHGQTFVTGTELPLETKAEAADAG